MGKQSCVIHLSDQPNCCKVKTRCLGLSRRCGGGAHRTVRRDKKYLPAPRNICYNNKLKQCKEGKPMDVRVGDTLLMKKPHPCGAKEFLVLRSGADFRIRCKGCGREVMVPRLKVERHIKQIIHPEPPIEG